MDFSILSLFAIRPAIYSDPINDKNVFHIPSFVVTQVVMSWKTRSVATLSISAAKIMKPEYCSLISFLAKASPFKGALAILDEAMRI